jgi:hypothetical protein
MTPQNQQSTTNLTRSASPVAPGKLSPQDLPQFIGLSFDDNGYASSLKHFLDLFASRKNPNGSPIGATFLFKTIHLSTDHSHSPTSHETAAALQLPLNAPVAHVHRTAMDTDGTTLLIANGIYRGDMVRIDVKLR